MISPKLFDDKWLKKPSKKELYDLVEEQRKEIERLNNEIKRLKQKLLIGKKANILFFEEVGVDKE